MFLAISDHTQIHRPGKNKKKTHWKSSGSNWHKEKNMLQEEMPTANACQEMCPIFLLWDPSKLCHLPHAAHFFLCMFLLAQVRHSTHLFWSLTHYIFAEQGKSTMWEKALCVCVTDWMVQSSTSFTAWKLALISVRGTQCQNSHLTCRASTSPFWFIFPVVFLIPLDFTAFIHCSSCMQHLGRVTL